MTVAALIQILQRLDPNLVVQMDDVETAGYEDVAGVLVDSTHASLLQEDHPLIDMAVR